jgi:hypothetical protein
MHNEKRSNLYPLSSNIWIIKSSNMKQVEHVTLKAEKRIEYEVLFGKPEGKV